MIYWSPSSGGFYHADVHTRMPDDVVEITAERHRELLVANAAGHAIVDLHGLPAVAPPKRIDIADLRRRAVAAVKVEASRRIRAVASLELQSNDNAALALAAIAGAMSDVATAALDRRERIDALRARSNLLEREVMALKGHALATFDPSLDSHWEVLP